MASSKEFVQYILEQLSELEGVSYRPMMGEVILYYDGKIVGGIYDDRLLVKPVPSALAKIKNPVYEKPYNGAKDMLLVAEVDDKEFLVDLLKKMYEELPAPKNEK